MAKPKHHLTRALVASVIALAVVAGPLAGIGRSAELGSFGGEASGFALRVVIDLSALPDQLKGPIQDNYATLRGALPPEAQALLPSQFPFVIDQRFIETLARLGQQNSALALLGSGFPESASASSSGQTDTVTTAQRMIPSADLPLIEMSVGELLASIGDGPRVEGDATLASVTASLNALGASGILPGDLLGAFASVTAIVNETVETVNETLEDILGEVSTSLAMTPADTLGAEVSGLLGGLAPGLVPGADNPEDVIDSLTQALQDVVQLPNLSDPLGTMLAQITNLDNNSVSQKTADNVVVSEATSKLASVNVLDFVRVGAIDLRSVSTAAGTPGSAANEAHCNLADVRIGDQNGVSLDGQNLYVNGTAVPVPTGEVAAIKSEVDSLLDVAGLEVKLCDAVQAEKADDGTSASQTVSAFHVEFAPTLPVGVDVLGMSAGDTLIRVIVDPSVQTEVAAQVATVDEPTKTEETPALPFTGAGAMGSILGGLGLAGGALALRRRLV